MVPATKVAIFFAQGPWLIDYDEMREEHVEMFIRNLRRKLAHEAIKAAGWELTVWGSAGSEKKCGSEAGHQWIELDGKHYCAFFMRQQTEPGEDFYNKKMPKHGIGLWEPYYKNILECGLKLGRNNDIGPRKLVGGYPSCWFQMNLGYTGKVCRSIMQEETVDCINNH